MAVYIRFVDAGCGQLPIAWLQPLQTAALVARVHTPGTQSRPPVFWLTTNAMLVTSYYVRQHAPS
jgi:hypothetical protein